MADGLVAVDADASIVEDFVNAGGDRRSTWAEVAVSWHPDEAEARRIAHERLRFSAQGWKVMAELPNPVNFEAATRTVRPEDVAAFVPCGDDVDDYINVVQRWADAGFTHISLCQSGPERQKEFRTWAEAELLPALRERFG